MSSSTWRPRGLTLIESLITLTLLLGIMGAVTGIIQEYSNVVRFSAQKDLGLQSVEVALDRMSRELSESIKVLAPTTLVASPDLRFERIDPASTTRLPLIPGPGPWNPAAPGDIIRVHYFLLNQTLMREVTPSSGAVISAPIAVGLTSFSCQQDALGNGLIQIQVAVQERAQLAQYACRKLSPVFTKARPRAFMLVLVILMLILLLTAGMAFVGKRAMQYRGTNQAVFAAVARELAESGLEDARVKLQKDLLFPPQSSFDQTSFTYSERLLAQDGTTLVGTYAVTIDTRYAAPPYSILVVTAVGQVNPALTSSPCMRQLRAELDIATKDRSTGLNNSQLFFYRNFQDEGSF